MRFILRWFVRFFGLLIFVRGSWMLALEWQDHHPALHWRSDAVLSSLEDLVHFAGHYAVESSFQLALAGLIIILLAFRR